MELTIGEPLATPRNSYAVNIKVYSGDGDGYDAFRVLGFRAGEDEPLLEELLKTIGRVKAAYPNGRGGDDDLASKVLGFELWFDEDYVYGSKYNSYEPEDEAEESYLRELAPQVEAFKDRTRGLYGRSHMDRQRGAWPLDVTLVDYSGSEASYSGHTVTYFDADGIEHSVAVVL